MRALRSECRSRGSHMGRRLVSLLLCVCITATLFINLAGTVLSTPAGATDKVMERKADGDTTDTYIYSLLSDTWGSRYAGRVWTDKTVFAYKSGENVINLNMDTDGYDGKVGFDADFAHVFSALTSTQLINEYPPAPIDLSIAVDMSASMAQDTRYPISGLNDPTDGTSTYAQTATPDKRTMAERIKYSRIQKTVDAINETIDALMEQNRNNRVSVVVYGAGATVLMPLAHYERIEDEPYLTVSGMETLYTLDDLFYDNTYGWVWTRNIDACYTLRAHANINYENKDHFIFNNTLDRTVSNNVDNTTPKTIDGYTEKVEAYPGYESWDSINYTTPFNGEMKELKADKYVGYYTNTQGGIYLAYSQLALATETTFTATLSTNQDVTVARIPTAIIMTDGGANFAFNEMDHWGKFYGAYSMHNVGDLKEGGGTYQGSYKAYDTQEFPYFREDNVSYDYTSDSTAWSIGHDDTDFSHRLAAQYQDGDEWYDAQVGDEWYNVYLPGEFMENPGENNRITSLYNKGMVLGDGTLTTPPAWNHAGIFYSNDGDPRHTGGTILQLIMTASYMKTVVNKHYTAGWDSGKATDDSRSELLTFTMSVDSENVPQWGRLRLYPSLDPEHYLFSEAHWHDSELTSGPYFASAFNGEFPLSPDTYIPGFQRALTGWNDWKSGSDAKVFLGGDIPGGPEAKYAQLPGGSYEDPLFDVTVTKTDVEDNIIYADEFFDVDSGELANRFAEILSKITGNVFTPISGSNDAGVGDSITYQDPLGEYMELKHDSIRATVHGKSEASSYDMAMLLFGDMHGLVRAGVYDYQWNNEYMTSKYPEYAGESPFEQGWYKGDDPTTARKALPGDIKTDDSGSYPSKDPNTGATYDNAEEAWADGWVMRFSFETLVSFVPIVDAPEDRLPKNLSEQVKNTVYTCYRFAGTQAERNALHRNPVYGTGIPEDLQAAWDEYYTNNKNTYPVGNEMYRRYPGVYRLSDIRVWNEHTGDFIDTSGAITPEEHGGYDDALYVNLPAAAVPTQVAEITLGATGPISYETNLGDDHTGDPNQNDYYAQSTPFRLFYAVGLDDDLILRNSSGKQTGVDISKLSAEYIASHTVPENNNIWFNSNYYSNTNYTGYTSDEGEYRTRGDAAVSFSPDAENRYYLFQKALPLFAHAYRVLDENGNLTAVDNTQNDWRNADGSWNTGYPNGSGNNTTTWENGESANTWSGGEFIGTYDSEEHFKKQLAAAYAKDPNENGRHTITDAKGYIYELPNNITDAIITFTDDQLDKVQSKSSVDGSYTNDSISFSSDDYFFLCVEYYLPTGGTGVDINGHTVPGTQTVRKVNRVIARKGSAFGSGLHSRNISNGDMLCWSDINGNCNIEIEYNSRTDTGDNTRGEPTFEKLTKSGEELKAYLKECGLRTDITVTWTVNGEEKTGTPLQRDCEYWTNLQNDPRMREAISYIKEGTTQEVQKNRYEELFDWAVSARTGGIRVGDMYSNIKPKGDGTTFTPGTQYYQGNITQTANNYYIPTLSERSTSGAGLIIDNYLGNNGRLEIANSTLMVTKTLTPPAGFTLTEQQKNQDFDYQVYIQDFEGEQTAQRIIFNPLSQSWQKRVESLDILTDNSSLLLDSGNNRALFSYENGVPKQVVEVAQESGSAYYYADENGNATGTLCCTSPDTLYYMYLSDAEDTLTYHLFGSNYEGYEYGGTTEKIEGAGTTAYYPPEMASMLPGGDNDNQKFRQATEQRPAGSREYWTSSAILIPYEQVREAEADSDTIDTEGTISVLALDSANGEELRWDYSTSDTTVHKAITDPFVLMTVIPDPDSTDSTIYSPYNSRTSYMTVQLYFGYKAELAQHLKTEGETFASCEHLNEYKLSEGDLYDQIIPSADRTDLFSRFNNQRIAQNTAEYTLKDGEGLLFTGLGNRVVYRFTERLTEKQLKNGYTLEDVSHVQQRGSESVYRPGVQQVPVYAYDGAIYGEYYPTVFQNVFTPNGLTWALDQKGNANTKGGPQMEPFAHTNATMWEYYATMEPNQLGNHHHPADADGVESSTFYNGDVDTGVSDNVEQNPSCKPMTDEGGCDVELEDGSTLHYIYHEGQLIDPHYQGEQSTFLRNMARYLVSPTVHFGVKGEVQPDTTAFTPATAPAEGYYDYNGVYSVFGNTGYFTEQSNYVNTVSPELFVLTKTLVDQNGNEVDFSPEEEFTYTLRFTPDEGALPTDTKLYMWKGDKTTWKSDVIWTDTAGKQHNMPTNPPTLEDYEKCIDDLQPLTPNSDGSYTLTLKANQTAVLYGMIGDTTYTVTETKSDKYPPVEWSPDTEVTPPLTPNDSALVKTGKVDRSNGNPELTNPQKVTVTTHRADFANLLQNGRLTVEKKVVDDPADKEQTFDFYLTLYAPEGGQLNKDDIVVTKHNADGTVDSEFEIGWGETMDDSTGFVTALGAGFVLKDGEYLSIDEIPLGATYSVKETTKNGYYLQHVADNQKDEVGKNGKYLTLKNNTVSGSITAENSSVYLLFANGKTPYLPFVGGTGFDIMPFLGTLLICLAFALLLAGKKSGAAASARKSQRAH